LGTVCCDPFADNNGEAYCPACGCVDPYFLKSRRKWECRGCRKHFSVTSGTIFASRKLDFTDILAAIALFVNAAKGISALQMARDLDVQHKTAWVMCHKLREAMAMGNDDVVLSGDVEIDGCYVGGHVRPENRKEDRKDRRLAANKDADRRVVIALRERQGRTLTFVEKSEADGVQHALARVQPNSVMHADEASHLGYASRILHDHAHQPLGSLCRRRRLHEPSRKFLLPPSSRGSRSTPPRQPTVSSPVQQRSCMA